MMWALLRTGLTRKATSRICYSTSCAGVLILTLTSLDSNQHFNLHLHSQKPEAGQETCHYLFSTRNQIPTCFILSPAAKLQSGRMSPIYLPGRLTLSAPLQHRQLREAQLSDLRIHLGRCASISSEP
jgi:hypothetical protein